MAFPVDFFRDEVRCGFYIPTVVKQAWAAELAVLSEIDRICVKYGIQYFADWGTIIGAVRHGGFVPWDDDLDICMLRDDYIRFRQVADAELPQEYVIHDYERQEDHWLFLARIVNHDKICFTPEYLNKHSNFPWLYPPELTDWEDSLREQVEPFVQEIEAALEWGGLCDLRENAPEEVVEACDAYYGSASPLVMEFVRAKKPVMIADYRV